MFEGDPFDGGDPKYKQPLNYMFCYTVNKFFNFPKKCLKKHLQFVMQLILEENDLIFCYLIKYVI